MKQLLLLSAWLLSTIVTAQEVIFDAEVSAAGFFSSEEINPFWFSTNSNTEVTPQTDFSSRAQISASLNFENESEIKVGTTVFYRNGLSNEFQRRDLFVQYSQKWFKATLGSKRDEVIYNGLSASNKNFIFSNNARPLPGLRIEANEPFRLSDVFGIDWGIGHYRLNDDRYVSDVNVHYKRLGLITSFENDSKLTLRIQHVAQWGGNSPDFGELPQDFSTFVKVFFAGKGEVEGNFGEALNAVGNHIGTYFIGYDFPTQLGQFEVYHEHPFEDGSGTRLANFPDGIWGVSFKPANEGFISQVLYEYIDTSDQSGATGVSGIDGYFGNNVYRSGWTYEGNIIGLPFILTDPNIIIDDTNSPIVSDRAKVHHFGIGGNIKKFDWQLKSTVVKSLGRYRNPFDPELNNWFNYITASYTSEKFGKLSIYGGFDNLDLSANVSGGGIRYTYVIQ